MTAFVYESERYVPEKIQILGISVEPAEEGKMLRDRVTRDCQEDRPDVPIVPYPLRLVSDPEAKLIRAIGAENESHRLGLIASPFTVVVDPKGKVQWLYASKGSADRATPVELAKTAVAVARGEKPVAHNPRKP